MVQDADDSTVSQNKPPLLFSVALCSPDQLLFSPEYSRHSSTGRTNISLSPLLSSPFSINKTLTKVQHTLSVLPLSVLLLQISQNLDNRIIGTRK